MGELENLPKEIRLKLYDEMNGEKLLNLSSTCKTLREEILEYVNRLLVTNQLIFITQNRHGWNANGTNAYSGKPQNVLKDWANRKLDRKSS